MVCSPPRIKMQHALKLSMVFLFIFCVYGGSSSIVVGVYHVGDEGMKG